MGRSEVKPEEHPTGEAGNATIVFNEPRSPQKTLNDSGRG